MGKLHEECGVFGIIGTKKTNVAASVYYGLFALQHRGQESCGICVNDDGVFASYKDSGLVNDVFVPKHLSGLGDGNMAIGHVRYGTAGTKGRINAQPIVVNHVKGRMALAHNGMLTNYFELREELELEGAIFHSDSDAELLSYLVTRERLNAPSIEEAVNRAASKIKGASSLLVMSPTKLIALRDERGIRPLCYGKTENGSYVVASESCALDAAGAVLIRELRPGEIMVFDGETARSIDDHCGKQESALCVFEYIYFARPDSVIDGCSVHAARRRAGAFLALEHPVHADVVIGVPDSGLDAAMGYSAQSGIPYGLGFIKNKYIGRTFIAPKKSVRDDKVKIKLNPVSETVKGKRVVLVDDSIVRGTTCARIVRLLREAGATEVHMRSSAPPFLYPCYYGTDISSVEDLIATNHSIEEVARIIGVDSLGYLSVENVSKLAERSDGKTYCRACFNAEYPTDIPDVRMRNKYEKKISEKNKGE
ncbi:MAG: amidophosphoribosyltransferase [Oscillospiraceae bacterium]|nr:amidophosphoribosyltransferase [Oscillospiraceae bacterium]